MTARADMGNRMTRIIRRGRRAISPAANDQLIPVVHDDDDENVDEETNDEEVGEDGVDDDNDEEIDVVIPREGFDAESNVNEVLS